MPSSREQFIANATTILGAIGLALFIRIVLFEAFEIEGPSMEPTLLNGDRVVVAKFLYGLFLPFTKEAVTTWGEPNVGDVVIVKSPADDIDIVKRVVGLPGDTIQVEDNVIIRNGKPIWRRNGGPCENANHGVNYDILAEDCVLMREKIGLKSYFTSKSATSSKSSAAFVRVPKDHIYVMGDHRDRSNDSRYFGTVPIARIKGRALMIYWSRDPNLAQQTFQGYRWPRVFHSVQ